MCDGGSTDATVRIAQETLASGDFPESKVAVFPKDKKQNIPANRNYGASMACGEYIFFVDSGVTIPETEVFITRALDHFKNNPQLVGLTASIKVVPEVATIMDNAVFGSMNMLFYILNNVFHRGAAQGKFQMVRRDMFEKVGGYREDLPAAEDTDLFYRLSLVGRTMIDTDMAVYHTARRAHAIGWPRLLFIWYRDAIWLFFFNKIISKEWKIIR